MGNCKKPIENINFRESLDFCFDQIRSVKNIFIVSQYTIEIGLLKIKVKK